MSLLQKSVKAASLKALLLHELEDLYDAEFQILEALPKIIECVKSSELSDALEAHRKETEGQVARLEDAFQALGHKPKREGCDGMKGVIKEGDHVLHGEMPDDVRDAAIIGAAQRVEHYEIAGYGTAKAHAKELGEHDVAELLHENMKEEMKADEKLSKIAEGKTNQKAATAK